MGYGYFPYIQGGLTPVIYDGSGQQLIALSHALGETTMVGAEATGDDLLIKSNSVDDYAAIGITGDGWLSLYGKGGVALYEQATAMLQTTYAANVTTIVGGIVGGDDLIAKANSTDSYSSVEILGNGNLNFKAGNAVVFFRSGTQYGNYSSDANNFKIISAGNRNISLEPAGTGKVKFGTYAAGAAADSTGYIPILDAAGNTRKLMVQA